MKRDQHQAPEECSEVKREIGPAQSLLPAPPAIFPAILLKSFQGAFVIARLNDQAPPALGGGNQAFDALTEQNKTPVHRLLPAVGGNYGPDGFAGGFRACHDGSNLRVTSNQPLMQLKVMPIGVFGNL